MGGLRVRAFGTMAACVTDALMLSEAMTLKNAAAGLDLGGGKAVLVDDGEWDARASRLRFLADVIQSLGGEYITAEDVGTSPEDMDVISEHTQWVAGRSVKSGGRGDPSIATARTVLGAMETAAAHHLAADSLTNLVVGIHGAGHVGAALAGLLAQRSARVLITDVRAGRASTCARLPGVTAVDPEGFIERDMDVLAPCAFRQLIGDAEAGRLRSKIVVGAANNQLTERSVAGALAQRDILYIPDFIANCGGIIHVGAEVLGFDAEEVERRVSANAVAVGELLTKARESGSLPVDVAERRAWERVRSALPSASLRANGR